MIVNLSYRTAPIIISCGGYRVWRILATECSSRFGARRPSFATMLPRLAGAR
jgi:hypothetical protein